MDAQTIKAQIESFQTPSGRGNIISIQDIKVINDSYNANLESARFGIDNLDSLYKGNRKIAVIGDMLELGDMEKEYHQILAKFIDEKGFMEVETPVLQPLYGGANARPFTTHHHALDHTLFLRIADELYLKRLIIGGIDRVYEIAKDFRNEGMDRNHNPEFTMLEFYWAYADYEDCMDLVENMIQETAE